MGVYAKAFLASFKPKPILTVSEWADRNRVLTTETSTVPGRWRTSFTPYLREPMDICASTDYKHIVFMFASQTGKALDLNTPVATVDGWKTQGTLQVGDYVFGMDGKPTKVIALSQVWLLMPCYEVKFSDGSSLVSNGVHEWSVDGKIKETIQLCAGDHVGNGFYVAEVTQVKCRPTKCIQVDNSDHLYLAGKNMIPTHNSEVINNVSGFFIDQEPSPQMLIQPTLNTAKEYSQIRIAPMIKASPALADKVIDEDQKTRRKDKPSMFYKPYPGGYLVLSGANSAASLASKPIRILLRDEIDRFEDIPGEGSPMELSEQRTRTFFNRKIVDSSTPLEKGKSRIETQFEKSDKRYYLVPCPHCDHEQELTWKESVQFDKEGTDQERSKTARLVCIECGEIMKGAGRADSEWIGRGRWVKTAESDIAGFYINALYSPLITLQEITLKWLEAVHSRSEDDKQTFYNLMLGLPYEKNGQDAAEYEDLYKKRREYYDAEIPDQVCLLTTGVDVQDDYLVGEVVGWGAGWESWGIEYRIFMGSPDNPRVWQELDEWLLKRRSFAGGGEIPVSSCFIDSGGHFTTEVYKFTKARESRRVFSIKGHARPHSPYISKPIKSGQVNANRFDLYVDAGKSKLWSRIHQEQEGPEYCHFPRKDELGYDQEYFKGFLSEKWVIKSVGSKTTGEWVKIRKRNEPWDVRNYAQAAAELVIHDPKQLEQLSQMIDRNTGAVTQKTTTRPRRTGTLSKGVEI